MTLKTLSRAVLAFALGLLLSVPALAQTAATTTWLDAAVTDTNGPQNFVVLDSTTNVEANGGLFVDGEYLSVTAVNTTTKRASVVRGSGGTRVSTHALNAKVYVATAAQVPYVFGTSAGRNGTCTAGNNQVLPQIDTSTGDIWYCTTNGNWEATNVQPVQPVVPRVTLTGGDYTAQPTDYIIAYTSVDTSGSTGHANNITLPSATGLAGKVLIIKDEFGLTNGTQTIRVNGFVDNNTSTQSASITTKFGVLRLYSNGTITWFSW